MKFSFAISFQPTSFQAVGTGDFRDALSALKDLGYHGIEIALRNPDIIDASFLEAELGKRGLHLVAIGTGQAYVDDGLSLTNLDQDVRQQAVERLRKHIDLAAMFDSQVILGLLRGKILGEDLREKQQELFKQATVELCAYAEKRGVYLTVEAINRYETNFLNTASEVLDLIRQIHSSSLKVLLDTFHMNIEEANPAGAILKAKQHLSHVHLADSNRRFPGEGHIVFSEILKSLQNIGYDGYLSGEMLPLPDLQTAMRNYISFLKEETHV